MQNSSLSFWCYTFNDTIFFVTLYYRSAAKASIYSTCDTRWSKMLALPIYYAYCGESLFLWTPYMSNKLLGKVMFSYGATLNCVIWTLFLYWLPWLTALPFKTLCCFTLSKLSCMFYLSDYFTTYYNLIVRLDMIFLLINVLIVDHM